MKLKLSAVMFASLTALVACGLFAGPTAAQTVTGSSFRVNSASASYSVDVQLKEKSGGKVIASTAPNREGKFAFRNIPEGQYIIVLIFNEEPDTPGDTSKPAVKKWRLTVTGVRGGPLKKDLDLKALAQSSVIDRMGRPSISAVIIPKVPRATSPGTESVVEGVITEK